MTKQQFEVAKEMWADGVPARDIAAHIGIDYQHGGGGAVAAFIAARPQHFPPRVTKVAA